MARRSIRPRSVANSSGSESAVKKTLKAAEQGKPHVQAERRFFFQKIAQLDPDKQIFLDECGINTSMTRHYARSPVGTRAYARCPVNYGPNVSVITAIRKDGVVSAMHVDGAVDGEVFLTFIREVLVPELRPGETVWMDNLGAHKVEGVAKTIKAAGAEVRYLPPYSPDCNPIEMVLSKFKGGIRALEPRTKKALNEAIVQSLDAITAEDTAGCYEHCGYV